MPRRMDKDIPPKVALKPHEILVAVRKRLEMTQYEMADLCGTNQPTICRWETGVHAIPLAMVRRIAKAYRVKLNDLIPPAAQLAS